VRVRILGQYYELKFFPYLGKTKEGHRYHGFCDHPDKPNKEIKLLSGERGKELLDSAIHEFTHASKWGMSEDFVKKYANDLTEFLLTPELWERITDGEG